MEAKRPSQYKQTSRKGKKAWTKNIDLDDLHVGLQENRDNLVKFGVENLDQLKSDNLFVVDTQGHDDVKRKNKNVKVLKSTEILNKRSKVPALNNRLTKNKNKVTKKDYEYLMAVSGRNKLANAKVAEIDRKGFATTKPYDVWSLDDDEDKDKPEILKKFSSTEWTKPKKAPSTLKVSSLIVEKIDAVPHAGRSYNPSFESWKKLISKEYTSEKEREDARLKLEEDLKTLKDLLKNAENSVEDDSEDDEEEEEDEEDEEETDFKLSLNKPVVLKKKTKAQRNKQKRHQERMKIEAEVKELKAKITQLQNIDKLDKELSDKTTKSRPTAEDKVQKKKKLGSKHKVKNLNLDIKLSDELTDSLRSLKPEGNLLQDTMFKLQSQGKVEARIAVKAKRRYKQKVTEKWTYKDFK